jgi:ATP-dependent DNA helicase RecQ
MIEREELKRKALAVLKRFYGYDSFFPMQIDVISHVMNGGDCVVLMPTGGGKSICYQIPALLSEGCAIIVSPLLALMKDQVDGLIANGIPAAAVNSQQSDAQNREIIEQVYAGRIKLLYISPERLITEVENWSSSMRISLIAIDEAHCISQWGHDFRPEYTRLSILKERFKNVPIMALTATADRLTRDDISRQLNIPDAKLFITSFDRPNISLNVLSEVSGKQKIKRIVNFIEKHNGQSGIIYCLSRKNTENMAKQLMALGIKAKAFHAGLETADKIQIQKEFINDDLPVICATVAFGMGIDKSNVRWVIHSNMPKNIESYYQEIGRAGRDGMPAEALMFYSFGDMATLMKFAQESGQSSVNIEKLRRMQQFAESSVCRRRILLSYFGERYEHDCNNCVPSALNKAESRETPNMATTQAIK